LNTPSLDQKQFRFRDNDGTDETDATWRQNTNVDDTQDTATVYRVRFTVAETAGFAANNKTFNLERRLNAGAWGNVTTSSSIVQAAASNLVDGNNTTQQISSPDTFQGGDGQSNDGSPGGSQNDFAGNDSWEGEISYQIIDADVAHNDTIDLRLAGLDSYTVADGTITVNKPAAGGRRVMVVS